MLFPTEKINENTVNIDLADTFGILSMIQAENKKIALEVQKRLNVISKAVDVIVENFKKDGRLLYFGAGTSGRLGVLDASECPPTFSTDPGMVVGVIAGGDYALRNAVEGAEDSFELAKNDFANLNVTKNDTVVAISASGNANYVVEILRLGRENNSKTILLTSNQNAKAAVYADIVIAIPTGAEPIAGSTRMKAGTAQKMVLNMLTTASMIKLGKTYQNLMIDVKPTNTKLKQRCIKIVSQIAEVDEDTVEKILKENGYRLKHAILKILHKIEFNDADKILKENENNLRKTINALKNIKD